MKRQLILTSIAFAMIANAAFAADEAAQAGPDQGPCETTAAGKTDFKEFPIKDLEELLKKEPSKLGSVVATNVGVSTDGKIVASKIENGAMAFFAANVLTQFPKLDAQKTQEFDNSLAIRFLREFGLKEMSLLGPDLTKADPFLDRTPTVDKSPSEDKIDETNFHLGDLTRRMNALLSSEQKSALQNALQGNFAMAMDQVEAKMRIIMTKIPVLKNNLGSFVSDKKYLQDLQVLLSGNLIQFQDDVVFMSELQARYSKVKKALEGLSAQGEAISNMKAAILVGITDPFTKTQVEKELVRFDQRVTDLKSGIAIADTFISMWQVVKDNHYDVMAGITRTLYFTVPIIGASAQLNNALARAENSTKAIQGMDNARNAMMASINKRLNKQVEDRQAHEIKKIQEDADLLGELLVGVMLVQQKMAAHDVLKVKELKIAREKYDKISADAQKQRQSVGLDRL